MQWKAKIKIIIAVTAVSFMASCVLSGKKTLTKGPLSIPENYGSLNVQQVTNLGSSSRPHLSTDAKRLLFVSEKRPDHENSQAYEKDLVKNTERRLTYQNGDVFEVQYYNNENQYIYSSSTDELKENSPYIEKSLLAMKGYKVGELVEKDDLGHILPRTEIYKANLDSSKISRITQKPSFDGDMSIRGKRHELVFVRWTEQVPSSYVLNVKTENLSQVGTEKSWTSDPAYSKDGDELAWVEKSEDSGWIILTGTAYGKNGKMRYQTPNRVRDLVWNSKGTEVFFSEVLTEQNAELFSLNLESGCKRQISFHSALDLHPYPSEDGTQLYFSSDRSGAFQIYRSNLDALPPCPESKPSLE